MLENSAKLCKECIRSHQIVTFFREESDKNIKYYYDAVIRMINTEKITEKIVFVPFKVLFYYRCKVARKKTKISW